VERVTLSEILEYSILLHIAFTLKQNPCQNTENTLFMEISDNIPINLRRVTTLPV
jgi:hypothetical protein